MFLQKGRPKTIVLTPKAPMASPAATIYDRDNAVVATPATNTFPIDTTVVADAGNTRQRVKVASVDDMSHGAWLRFFDSAFGYARARVSGFEGADVVRLVEALPAVPADGAVVQGVDVQVIVPAFQDFAIGYVLEVVDQADEQAEAVSVDLNIVRYPPVGPCFPEHVRDCVQRFYSGEKALLADTELQARIADETNAQIYGRLLAAGILASSFWSPAALSTIRPSMLRLVMAEQYGLYEANVDKGLWMRDQRAEVKERISAVSQGTQTRDVDNDGIATDGEVAGDGQNTITLER